MPVSLQVFPQKHDEKLEKIRPEGCILLQSSVYMIYSSDSIFMGFIGSWEPINF